MRAVLDEVDDPDIEDEGDTPAPAIAPLPPGLAHPAPVVVCSHGDLTLRSTEFRRQIVPDCPEARFVAFWLSRVPEGCVFRVFHHPAGVLGPKFLRGGRTIDGELYGALPEPAALGMPEAAPLGVPPGAVELIAALEDIGRGEDFEIAMSRPIDLVSHFAQKGLEQVVNALTAALDAEAAAAEADPGDDDPDDGPEATPEERADKLFTDLRVLFSEAEGTLALAIGEGLKSCILVALQPKSPAAMRDSVLESFTEACNADLIAVELDDDDDAEGVGGGAS